MYRPRQPGQEQSPDTATTGWGSATPGGSLLNARPAGQHHLRNADISSHESTSSVQGLTPGSLLDVSRRSALPSQQDVPQSHSSQPHPSQAGFSQNSHSSFLPGLAAIESLGIDDFITWLRQGWLWIAAATAMCIAAALVFALTATPRFVVFTDIIIDPSNLNIVSDDVFTANPLRDSQIAEVENKMRVLTSRNVLARVIDDLNLTEDPEFTKPAPLARLKALFGARGEAGDDNRFGIMRALGERIVAYREERSFVVVLSVWSEDPAKAVALSEAIVAAFEEELFQSVANSVSRIAQSLTERLDELRDNVTVAERRVEEFRRANGLQSANGELVSSQLSAELNTQVLETQQRLIQAQSRFDQMNSAIEQGRIVTASIFDSETMAGLRQQYNTLQQQIGAVENTYGPRHPRMVSLLSERGTLETAIDREARRILGLARADLTREQAAYNMLRGKADEEQANVFTDNAALVQLRDLEREARSRAAIYETYLARTQQITEREKIDTTNVRIISRPMPPAARAWPPRTVYLLAASAFAGLALGVGLALAFGFWRFVRMPHHRQNLA